MKKFLIAASAALCVASAASAQPYPANGYIGVYSDMAGTLCCSTVPTFMPASLYVVAHLAGASAAGMTTAEFRLEFSNDPRAASSWSFAAAGNVYIGDVFDYTANVDPTPPATEGANIGFPVCQNGPAVLLGTISVIVFNPAWTGVEILTKGRNPAANPDPIYDCPLVTLCDAEFTKVCLTIPDGVHGQSVNFRSGVNLAGCNTSCSPVAVADKNWSAVKGLYR
jgi:hypothetical protein